MKNIFHGFIAILVIALIIVAYPTVFPGNASAQDARVMSDTGKSVQDAFSGGAVDEKVFVKLLASLRSASFDLGFFSLDTFTSLVDFSVDIDPQPVGRRNPFAPIGETGETGEIGGLNSLLDGAFSGLGF